MSRITTYTGKRIDPLNPEEECIDIRDIAHALSLICRGNGHIKFFYSVAQHSIACAEEAIARGCTWEVILGCLLHDASEAYLSDITRPVKECLPEYRRFEEQLQTLIFSKWLSPALTDEEEQQVCAVDDALLYHEFLQLTGKRLWEPQPPLTTTPLFSFEAFEDVQKQFLEIFEELL